MVGTTASSNVYHVFEQTHVMPKFCMYREVTLSHRIVVQRYVGMTFLQLWYYML